MKNLVLIFLGFSLLCITIKAQSDTLYNQLDANGLKDGYWQKQYPNGNLMYKVEFKKDVAIGIMYRYFENGGIQAKISFYDDGVSAKAKLYYEDGDLSAEGYYYNMLKDSLWKYYSFYTNVLVSDEYYIKGKKNGVHNSFYSNGQVSEEISWQNDYKEGKWVQYFPDGKEKMKTNHNFNMVNGRYYFYYDNGLLMILGNFADNKRHGPWVFYDNNGKEKYKIEYDFGNAINANDLMKNDEEYFKFIDENIGNFDEPLLEDFFPGGGY